MKNIIIDAVCLYGSRIFIFSVKRALVKWPSIFWTLDKKKCRIITITVRITVGGRKDALKGVKYFYPCSF